MHSLRSNWPGARREGGSVSAAILDRLSNEAPGQFQRNPEGGMACSSQGLNSELRLNEAKENRRWTTMDDHAFRFGSVTQRVIGWLRVSRFLSATLVVYSTHRTRTDVSKKEAGLAGQAAQFLLVPLQLHGRRPDASGPVGRCSTL